MEVHAAKLHSTVIGPPNINARVHVSYRDPLVSDSMYDSVYVHAILMSLSSPVGFASLVWPNVSLHMK